MDFVFVQGMGDFLSEMAVMMNQSKPGVRYCYISFPYVYY